MTYLDILAGQLVDPFRIGLLGFLVLTTLRTLAHTGFAVPLLVGLVFVAILIPTSFSGDGQDWTQQVAVGLGSNAIILAVMLAIRAVIVRLMPARQPK